MVLDEVSINLEFAVSLLKSVALAIELATAKRDQAGRVLAQLERSHAFALGQLAQLQDYAAETDIKWTAAAQVNATPELMRHHYQFMGRLSQAIELQKDAIYHSDCKLTAAKKQLLDADLKLASLKLILAKKQADLTRLQSRREQKQMDEFAAMQTSRITGRCFMGEQS